MADSELEIVEAEVNPTGESLKVNLNVHRGFWEMFRSPHQLPLPNFSGLPTFRASLLPSVEKILLADNSLKFKIQSLKYKQPPVKYLITHTANHNNRTTITSNIFPNQVHQQKLNSLQQEIDQLERMMQDEYERAVTRLASPEHQPRPNADGFKQADRGQSSKK